MIADRVREVRKALHLTQKEFSRRLGISKDVLGGIEYKKVEPKPVFLEHICYIFHVSPDWLYHGKGDMFTVENSERLLEITDIFGKLDDKSQEYVLQQMKGLLELQNSRQEKDSEKS